MKVEKPSLAVTAQVRAKATPARNAEIAGSDGSPSANSSEEVMSEAAYLARLGRSIRQMKTGEVQPVREGLVELRRELAADETDNNLD